MSTNSRAYDIWLRKPEEAQQLLESRRAELDGDGLSLLSWLVLTNERDDKKAEEIALAAIQAGGDTRFATAALAEVHKWRGEFDRAAEIVRSAREKYPMIPWYALTLADVLKDGGRIDEAESLLESVVNDCAAAPARAQAPVEVGGRPRRQRPRPEVPDRADRAGARLPRLRLGLHAAVRSAAGGRRPARARARSCSAARRSTRATRRSSRCCTSSSARPRRRRRRTSRRWTRRPSARAASRSRPA